MKNSLRVFLASYGWAGSYGAFHDIECVVCANTRSEALGLALEANDNTCREFWTVEELNINRVAAYVIHAEST